MATGSSGVAYDVAVDISQNNMLQSVGGVGIKAHSAMLMEPAIFSWLRIVFNEESNPQFSFRNETLVNGNATD
jgi:hypothetical protein